MYISKRSGMDHTVLPANTPCLPYTDLYHFILGLLSDYFFLIVLIARLINLIAR